MLHSKMGLEMCMRDALDGMEQLASMYAYGRLPADMEILDSGHPPVPQQQTAPPRLDAQILQFPSMRPAEAQAKQDDSEKHNKFIML